MQIPHVSQRSFVYYTPLKTKDTTALLNEAPPVFKVIPSIIFLPLPFFPSTACRDFFPL